MMVRRPWHTDRSACEGQWHGVELVVSPQGGEGLLGGECQGNAILLPSGMV